MTTSDDGWVEMQPAPIKVRYRADEASYWWEVTRADGSVADYGRDRFCSTFGLTPPEPPPPPVVVTVELTAEEAEGLRELLALPEVAGKPAGRALLKLDHVIDAALREQGVGE